MLSLEHFSHYFSIESGLQKIFCIISDIFIEPDLHPWPKCSVFSPGLGVALLCIGLVFRMISSFLAVLKLGLTLREMFFIPLAWLPKATVQAAIGSVALDTAREKGNEAGIELGSQVNMLSSIASHVQRGNSYTQIIFNTAADPRGASNFQGPQKFTNKEKTLYACLRRLCI